MKFLGLATLALVAPILASPSQPLVKRAAVTDACNVGFCTQNGGHVYFGVKCMEKVR